MDIIVSGSSVDSLLTFYRELRLMTKFEPCDVIAWLMAF